MSSPTPAPATGADAHDEPIPQPPPAALSAGVSSAAVLITEQEVLFGTAAAAPARRESISRRFAASMRRIFAVSAHTSSRPRRTDVPKRYEFLERALMAREMDRL